MAAPLPRSLGRFGRIAPMPSDERRTVAIDTVTDREVELVRFPFGRARREERDAFVRRLRERTAVVHPALRAVLDGGEWDEDAFAALELLRGEQALSAWLAASPDEPARARVAAELVGAADALVAAALAPAGTVEVIVDDYGQPKVLGLEQAEAAGEASAALAEVVALAALAAPGLTGARLREARTRAERAALAADLERQARAAPPGRPFAADAARGEDALAAAAGSRHMLVALGVIAFFALLVAVVLVILR